MSKNFIQEGKVLTFENIDPVAGDINSGDIIVIGAIAGVAKTSIPNGKKGAVGISGIYSLPKASGVVSQGQKLYWSDTNSNLSTTATGNTLVGVAASAALSADSNVQLLLNVGL